MLCFGTTYQENSVLEKQELCLCTKWSNTNIPDEKAILYSLYPIKAGISQALLPINLCLMCVVFQWVAHVELISASIIFFMNCTRVSYYTDEQAWLMAGRTAKSTQRAWHFHWITDFNAFPSTNEPLCRVHRPHLHEIDSTISFYCLCPCANKHILIEDRLKLLEASLVVLDIFNAMTSFLL